MSGQALSTSGFTPMRMLGPPCQAPAETPRMGRGEGGIPGAAPLAVTALALSAAALSLHHFFF